eukprot:UN17316
MRKFHQIFDRSQNETCDVYDMWNKNSKCQKVKVPHILQKKHVLNRYEYITPLKVAEIFINLSQVNESDVILGPVCGSADF